MTNINHRIVEPPINLPFALNNMDHSKTFDVEVFFVRDWSLITGRGLQNWKIAGPELFAPPAQDRVKLFAPPF